VSGYTVQVGGEPGRTEQAAAALRRVLDIAARVIRGLGRLATVAAACAAAAWLVWAIDAPPGATSEWVDRVVVLGALLAPPAVLLLFLAGLRDLLGIADRARALPADLRAWRRDPGGTDGPRGARGLLAALFRLTRLVLTSRDLLSPYAAITFALRPAILLATLAATAAALLEVPATLIAIPIMLLS
jgi:hypothetical protein